MRMSQDPFPLNTANLSPSTPKTAQQAMDAADIDDVPNKRKKDGFLNKAEIQALKASTFFGHNLLQLNNILDNYDTLAGGDKLIDITELTNAWHA